MKIKEGYTLKEIAGSNIVVPLGDTQLSFRGIMTLNGVGAFVWKLLEKGADREELIKQVLSQYDIDGETAAKDIDKYIAKLRAEEIIED